MVVRCGLKVGQIDLKWNKSPGLFQIIFQYILTHRLNMSWICPIGGHSDPLCHTAPGHILLHLISRRLLPPGFPWRQSCVSSDRSRDSFPPLDDTALFVHQHTNIRHVTSLGAQKHKTLRCCLNIAGRNVLWENWSMGMGTPQRGAWDGQKHSNTEHNIIWESTKTLNN